MLPKSKAEEFEVYLKAAKPLVLNLTGSKDRVKAALWLKKLIAESDEELKTDYLKLFLLILQRRKLVGFFKRVPRPCAPLLPFPNDADLQSMADALLDDDEEKRICPCDEWPPYFAVCSTDLSEYAVYQTIPDFGIHAYYALSPQPIMSWEKSKNALIDPGIQAAYAKGDYRPEMTPNISCFVPVEESETSVSKKSSQKGNSSQKDIGSDHPSLEQPGKSNACCGGNVEEETAKTPDFLGPYIDSVRKKPVWGSNLVHVKEPEVRRKKPKKHLTFDFDDVINSDDKLKLACEKPIAPCRKVRLNEIVESTGKFLGQSLVKHKWLHEEPCKAQPKSKVCATEEDQESESSDEEECPGPCGKSIPKKGQRKPKASDRPRKPKKCPEFETPPDCPAYKGPETCPTYKKKPECPQGCPSLDQSFASCKEAQEAARKPKSFASCDSFVRGKRNSRLSGSMNSSYDNMRHESTRRCPAFRPPKLCPSLDESLDYTPPSRPDRDAQGRSKVCPSLDYFQYPPRKPRRIQSRESTDIRRCPGLDNSYDYPQPRRESPDMHSDDMYGFPPARTLKTCPGIDGSNNSLSQSKRCPAAANFAPTSTPKAGKTKGGRKNSLSPSSSRSPLSPRSSSPRSPSSPRSSPRSPLSPRTSSPRSPSSPRSQSGKKQCPVKKSSLQGVKGAGGGKKKTACFQQDLNRRQSVEFEKRKPGQNSSIYGKKPGRCPQAEVIPPCPLPKKIPACPLADPPYTIDPSTVCPARRQGGGGTQDDDRNKCRARRPKPSASLDDSLICPPPRRTESRNRRQQMSSSYDDSSECPGISRSKPSLPKEDPFKCSGLKKPMSWPSLDTSLGSGVSQKCPAGSQSDENLPPMYPCPRSASGSKTTAECLGQCAQKKDNCPSMMNVSSTCTASPDKDDSDSSSTDNTTICRIPKEEDISSDSGNSVSPSEELSDQLDFVTLGDSTDIAYIDDYVHDVDFATSGVPVTTPGRSILPKRTVPKVIRDDRMMRAFESEDEDSFVKIVRDFGLKVPKMKSPPPPPPNKNDSCGIYETPRSKKKQRFEEMHHCRPEPSKTKMCSNMLEDETPPPSLASPPPSVGICPATRRSRKHPVFSGTPKPHEPTRRKKYEENFGDDIKNYDYFMLDQEKEPGLDLPSPPSCPGLGHWTQNVKVEPEDNKKKCACAKKNDKMNKIREQNRKQLLERQRATQERIMRQKQELQRRREQEQKENAKKHKFSRCSRSKKKAAEKPITPCPSQSLNRIICPGFSRSQSQNIFDKLQPTSSRSRTQQYDRLPPESDDYPIEYDDSPQIVPCGTCSSFQPRYPTYDDMMQIPVEINDASTCPYAQQYSYSNIADTSPPRLYGQSPPPSPYRHPLCYSPPPCPGRQSSWKQQQQYGSDYIDYAGRFIPDDNMLQNEQVTLVEDTPERKTCPFRTCKIVEEISREVPCPRAMPRRPQIFASGRRMIDASKKSSAPRVCPILEENEWYPPAKSSKDLQDEITRFNVQGPCVQSCGGKPVNESGPLMPVVYPNSPPSPQPEYSFCLPSPVRFEDKPPCECDTTDDNVPSPEVQIPRKKYERTPKRKGSAPRARRIKYEDEDSDNFDSNDRFEVASPQYKWETPHDLKCRPCMKPVSLKDPMNAYMSTPRRASFSPPCRNNIEDESFPEEYYCTDSPPLQSTSYSPEPYYVEEPTNAAERYFMQQMDLRNTSPPMDYWEDVDRPSPPPRPPCLGPLSIGHPVFQEPPPPVQPCQRKNDYEDFDIYEDVRLTDSTQLFYQCPATRDVMQRVEEVDSDVYDELKDEYLKNSILEEKIKQMHSSIKKRPGQRPPKAIAAPRIRRSIIPPGKFAPCRKSDTTKKCPSLEKKREFGTFKKYAPPASECPGLQARESGKRSTKTIRADTNPPLPCGAYDEEMKTMLETLRPSFQRERQLQARPGSYRDQQ